MAGRVQVQAMVPLEVAERAKKMARSEGRTLSAVIGQVLAAYVGVTYEPPLPGRRPGVPQPPNVVTMNGRQPWDDPFAAGVGELVREKFVEDA